MSPRKDPLAHKLAYAREAVALSSVKHRADLDSDRTLNLALARLLEIIGEAASRVPPEARLLYPGIPWPEMVGLRNRLIHGYDSVDFDILWRIIIDDLPPLIAALEGILRSEE